MGFKVSLLSLEQFYHNNGVIMSAMASQITSLTIVYSIVYSGTDQRKHCGELIGNRWISRTNGQWRGTCFHLMTSSWCQWTPDNIGMLVTWSWQRTTQTLQQNKEQNKYTCIVVQHYSGAIIGAMASQITSLTIVYATVYSGADQRKHKSSASLAFMQVIRRWPVNSPHKGPVTRKKVSIWWRHHDTIQIRNVHMSVLNDVLWDMGQVHLGICEIDLLAIDNNLVYHGQLSSFMAQNTYSKVQ